jgi:Zn-dependent protease
VSFDFTQLLLIMPPILFALTFHEFAHAWSARKLGDPTAESMGRLTLNPLAHLDPAGTIMLIITVMAGVGLGWAKPVPVDMRYLKNPRRDMMWIALAGPVSNIVLAFIFGGFLLNFPPSDGPLDSFRDMVRYAFSINLTLAFFNLIPIPPLDGSRVVTGLLPPQQAYQYSQLETYGPLMLIGFIMVDQMLRLGLIATWISIPANFVANIIISLFS